MTARKARINNAGRYFFNLDMEIIKRVEQGLAQLHPDLHFT
jgi:hypothetical protein